MTAQVNEPTPSSPDRARRKRLAIVRRLFAAAKDTVQEAMAARTCAVDAIEGQLHTHVGIFYFGTGARPAGASAVHYACCSSCDRRSRLSGVLLMRSRTTRTQASPRRRDPATFTRRLRDDGQRRTKTPRFERSTKPVIFEASHASVSAKPAHGRRLFGIESNARDDTARARVQTPPPSSAGPLAAKRRILKAVPASHAWEFEFHRHNTL